MVNVNWSSQLRSSRLLSRRRAPEAPATSKTKLSEVFFPMWKVSSHRVSRSIA